MRSSRRAPVDARWADGAAAAPAPERQPTASAAVAAPAVARKLRLLTMGGSPVWGYVYGPHNRAEVLRTQYAFHMIAGDPSPPPSPWISPPRSRSSSPTATGR